MRYTIIRFRQQTDAAIRKELEEEELGLLRYVVWYPDSHVGFGEEDALQQC